MSEVPAARCLSGEWGCVLSSFRSDNGTKVKGRGPVFLAVPAVQLERPLLMPLPHLALEDHRGRALASPERGTQTTFACRCFWFFMA